MLGLPKSSNSMERNPCFGRAPTNFILPGARSRSLKHEISGFCSAFSKSHGSLDSFSRNIANIIQVSHGWLGYIGDDLLPNYIGIIS